MDVPDGYVAKLEACRRTAPDGSEYWLARDLQELLGYDTWRRFSEAIQRAQGACASAGESIPNHFAEADKMVGIGSGARRETEDFFLSRYACYLIAMNGDVKKPEIGAAQQYFAVQARKQELQAELTDIERRALHRERVRDANKKLGEAAKNANVQRYGVFHDAGYQTLYDGLGVREIKRRKSIAEKDDLLDCAGRAELAINEFRITQTEEKILRDNVKTESMAIRVHEDVGSEVRAAVARIGGTMPENLPAEPNINKLVAPKRRRELAALNRDGGDGEGQG